MKPTTRLFQQCHITLFTRQNCSLCTDAKQVLSNVWDKRPFQFKEIDVMTAKDEQWKMYQFDTPVIHINSAQELTKEGETTTASVRKLMHRFKEAEVEKLMDDV
ncbi:hypothetical protein EJ08DRAFT_551533, partial [Tothia fuscella]